MKKFKNVGLISLTIIVLVCVSCSLHSLGVYLANPFLEDESIISSIVIVLITLNIGAYYLWRKILTKTDFLFWIFSEILALVIVYILTYWRFI